MDLVRPELLHAPMPDRGVMGTFGYIRLAYTESIECGSPMVYVDITNGEGKVAS